jgi:hypothetical protein
MYQYFDIATSKEVSVDLEVTNLCRTGNHGAVAYTEDGRAVILSQQLVNKLMEKYVKRTPANYDTISVEELLELPEVGIAADRVREYEDSWFIKQCRVWLRKNEKDCARTKRKRRKRCGQRKTVHARH